MSEDSDMKIAQEIADRYGVGPEKLFAAMFAIMALGFGRNKDTANTLRAIIDIIECPIKSYEEEAEQN